MFIKLNNFFLIFSFFILSGCAASDYSKFSEDVTIAKDIKSIDATDGSYTYKTGKNIWTPKFGHPEGLHYALKCPEFYVKSLNGKLNKRSPDNISESYKKAILECDAKPVIITMQNDESIFGILLYNPLPPKKIGSDYSIGPGGTKPIISIPNLTIFNIKNNPDKIYSVYETYVFNESENLTFVNYSWILWLSAFPFKE